MLLTLQSPYLQRDVDIGLVRVAVHHQLRQHMHGNDVVSHPCSLVLCNCVQVRDEARKGEGWQDREV